MSKRICNNNISEYRYEHYSTPNQKEKRIKKIKSQEIKNDTIVYDINFNGIGIIGIGFVLAYESLPPLIKILLSFLFICSSLSVKEGSKEN